MALTFVYTRSCHFFLGKALHEALFDLLLTTLRVGVLEYKSWSVKRSIRKVFHIFPQELFLTFHRAMVSWFGVVRETCWWRLSVHTNPAILVAALLRTGEHCRISGKHGLLEVHAGGCACAVRAANADDATYFTARAGIAFYSNQPMHVQCFQSSNQQLHFTPQTAQ